MNHGIKVSDASKFDRIDKLNEGTHANIKLIRVDVAGNSSPYIMHYDKEELYSALGRSTKEELKIPSAQEKGGWHRYFSHKITKEQAEYIKQHKMMNMDDAVPMARVITQYMLDSLRHEDEYRVNNRLKDGDKVEGTDKNTKKRTIKKAETKETRDGQYIDSILGQVEEKLGMKLSKEYVEKLKENKTTMKLESIHEKIGESLREIIGKRVKKDEISNKALEIFIYSKLTNIGFSSIVKKDLRKAAVGRINDNLDDNFEKLRTVISNGTKIENLKGEVLGVQKNNNQKKDEVLVENDNLNKGESVKGAVYKDKTKDTLGNEKEKLKELIKRRYINRIEQKKQEIKAKKAEIEMMWAELQMREAELKKLELEEEELNINKEIDEYEN